MKCLHSTISGSSIIYLSLQIRAKSIRKSFENRTSKGTEEKNESSSLFLFLSGTIGGRAQAPPRNIGGDVMRINSPRHRLYCICLRQYATKQNTISLSGIELSEGCADRMVIYCSTFGLRFVL